MPLRHAVASINNLLHNRSDSHSLTISLVRLLELKDSLWRVYLFFRFSHAGVNYPCVLVRWYSTSEEPDTINRLWIVQPESTRPRQHHMSIIHVDTIVCGTHLLPRFPSDVPVYRQINYTDVLDLFTSFYVNKSIDHHAFEIAF
jgi:hypothetical protein